MAYEVERVANDAKVVELRFGSSRIQLVAVKANDPTRSDMTGVQKVSEGYGA